MIGELPLRHQPIEGALEVAAVGDHRLGDVFENGLGNVEPVMDLRRGPIARLQDAPAQLEIGGADLEGDAALQPRAHPLIDRFQFRRRPVGGDHDLALAVDERIEHVAEFLLH